MPYLLLQLTALCLRLGKQKSWLLKGMLAKWLPVGYLGCWLEWKFRNESGNVSQAD